MFKDKLQLYTRITIALVAAIITMEFLQQNVFVASTPRIRPDLADKLVEKSLALINVDSYISFFRDDSDEKKVKRLMDSVANVPKRQIVPGVYAAESEYGVYLEVNEKEINFNSLQYQKKDGSIITLEVPEGMEPPPPGLF
jgi:hypothetical protein